MTALRESPEPRARIGGSDLPAAADADRAPPAS
jgi:hypothetical protein